MLSDTRSKKDIEASQAGYRKKYADYKKTHTPEKSKEPESKKTRYLKDEPKTAQLGFPSSEINLEPKGRSKSSSSNESTKSSSGAGRKSAELSTDNSTSSAKIAEKKVGRGPAHYQYASKQAAARAARKRRSIAAKRKAKKPTGLETAKTDTSKLPGVGKEKEARVETAKTDTTKLPTIEEKKTTAAPRSAARYKSTKNRRSYPGLLRIASRAGKAVGRGARYVAKGPEKRTPDKSV